MRLKLIGGALMLAALAACDDRMGDYPTLLPTDQLLAEPALPSHAAGQGNDPAPVSEGLTRRAAGLAATVPAVASDGDLSRRADALRVRAKALGETSLDGCPDGDTTCPAPTTTE